MTVIDERGRLFGRLNFIDALVALVGLAAVGFLVVGYLLYRLPPTPAITSHDPATLVENQAQRVRLQGVHFTPYMRAFLRRTDQADFVRRSNEIESQDAFTLMNATRVPFLLESPTLAELEMPALPAGTYDILLYDEIKLVRIETNLITVKPDPNKVANAPLWRPTASLLVYGAFAGVQSGEVAALKTGAHVTAGGVSWGDVLAVDAPSIDLAPLRMGDAVVPAAAVIDRSSVPARMRVRCMMQGENCLLGSGEPIKVGGVLSGTVGAARVQYRVAEVAPDVPLRRHELTVSVRFVGRREVMALVKSGARDLGHSAAVLPLAADRGATVTSAGEPKALTGQVQLSLSDLGLESVTAGEPLATVDATVVVPATEAGQLWMYKGQAVRSGSVLLFETAQYAIRGWILRVQ